MGHWGASRHKLNVSELYQQYQAVSGLKLAVNINQ